MQRDVADRPAAAPEPVGAAPEPEPGAAGTAPGRPPGWPGRRALAVEGLVVYLALQLLTVPFLPALRRSRETFYDDVLVGFFMPEKHGLAKLLRDGFLPTWLDNQYGGEPLIANLQHAVLYPGNVPFWLLPTSTALERSPPCTWPSPGSACGPTAARGCGPAAGGPPWPGSRSAWARSPCTTSP
jgi:hypothetical protein